MKCNRCGKENPAEIHTCTAPLAIALAERLDVPPGAPLFVDAAAELRRLYAENEALRQALAVHPEKRPQNCGTGFCSCIECPYPDHFPEAGKMVEPFGYFRSTMGGWEDCAETDEGARPLYEAPRPQHEQDNDLLTIAYMAGFDAGKKTAPQPDHFPDAGKMMEREWVQLTANEILNMMPESISPDYDRDLMVFAREIEKKLREKNT